MKQWKTTGVSTVTTGPNVSKPFIHGLGYNRILTLFDGIRQEGQQWGDEHGIEVDENTVDRIEIVKGPASLTYGSDALAGVVNLLPAPPVPNGTIKAHVETNYQSNNNLIGHILLSVVTIMALYGEAKSRISKPATTEINMTEGFMAQLLMKPI